MSITIRQHAGAGLVAAAVAAAALAEGLFNPIGYAAASIVIWAAVIAGLVGRALPAAPIGRTAAAAGLCLAATALLATASVAWASDQGRAFEEAVRASFYLGLFVLAACTASRPARSQWLGGLAAGLGAVTAIALFAYLQPGILDSARSDIPNAAGRLAYPIGYWNGAGALFAITAVLLADGAATAPSRLLRTAATAAIPLTVLGIWLASSRGAGVALFVGLVVLIAGSADRGRRLVPLAIGLAGSAALILAALPMDALTSGVTDAAMRADGDRMSAVALAVVALTGAVAWRADGWAPRIRVTRQVAFAAAAVAAVGVIAGVVAVDPAKRFDEFEAPPPTERGVPVGAAELSSNGRWQFWGEALDAFESDPITGVGAGGYEDWWARHAPLALFVRNAHSLPLQQAAELGIAGILLFCGFVAAVVVAARRRLAAGLQGDGGVLLAVIAAAAVGAAVDWTWEIPAVFGPAVVCAALLTASAPSRGLARDGYWLGLGTVAAAWVAMVAAGLVVLTELELRQSRDAAGSDDIAAAIDRARAAKTVQPWSSEPYTQLALLEEQRGDLPAAIAALRQAEDRDSEDWRLLLIEASLLRKSGDGAAAEIAYNRAQSLSPVSLFIPIEDE
jgi:O-Antigen ligase